MVTGAAGVDIGHTARYMFSQPWPFPASLMLGMVAEAQSEDIVLGTCSKRDVMQDILNVWGHLW
jgi:NAD+ diphosphatase